MNTDEYKRLATEAKARADKATPGPWKDEYGNDDTSHIRDSNGDYMFEVLGQYTDTEFIAHARTDVPTLADAVLALIERNAQLQQVAEELREGLGAAFYSDRHIYSDLTQHFMQTGEVIDRPTTTN